MLKVNNIEVVYNDVILVLKGISLEVPEGGVVALLGANGAGKTTTLKAISGILDSENGDLEDGEIEFMDEPIHRMDPDRIVRLGITMVPEGRRVFEDLNVVENIMIGGHVRRDRAQVRKDLDMIFDYFPVLADRKGQLAIFLSGGEQQMLVIGRALISKPRLMMLDEPSLGLAPLLVREIFGMLKRINSEQNTGILLVEQNARIALNFARYGYIMENGKIMLDGPRELLMENEDVKEFYLGVTDEDKKKSYANVKHYKRRKRWLS
ncbi:MAG: ABC transporter ATP-binding protein [Deltaproteobacteria bacterium]|nr:ABC transporter ATP-binding protein [Deltaproteobacteria bacterium]MBW1924881.1 ABC transporter ATP-binding protein [Deltaproteobacteria bacterium]MBW1950048.1 ABC transporter ATP-binding protein [Deltaproteobacteria bacterium]MBW2007971.1 ABC transporter ATP-binding protein [Deltaproteobacteria bacterium]RLB38777.1 MAG: ABC transporter ATP-binding protein [Deltaproteobacteria bacterium]